MRVCDIIILHNYSDSWFPHVGCRVNLIPSAGGVFYKRQEYSCFGCSVPQSSLKEGTPEQVQWDSVPGK